jgi:hypothetical protein
MASGANRGLISDQMSAKNEADLRGSAEPHSYRVFPLGCNHEGQIRAKTLERPLITQITIEPCQCPRSVM